MNSYLTGAYPVTRGYLVMMRQPLYEIRSADEVTAHFNHDRLVSVLAEAGVSIVRAERLLAARRRAEKQEAACTRPVIFTLVEPTLDTSGSSWQNQDAAEPTAILG
jgi:hypothetical protein